METKHFKNTRTITLRWAIIVTLAASASSSWATEEEEARQGCERVEALHVEELRAQGQKALTIGCRQNVQPPAFWKCVEDKMKAGNSWMYSTNQCEDKKAG
jgi:hypothetical protein